MQDTTFTQSLLDRYFAEEQALRERKLSLAELDVHLDATNLAMLNTIAKRFNKSRSEVAEELLAHALVDLFTRFEAGERKLIARDADDAARAIATGIAEENGLKNVELKTGVWANHDREATKAERKRAKLAPQNDDPTDGNELTSSALSTHTEQAQSANDTDADHSVTAPSTAIFAHE